MADTSFLSQATSRGPLDDSGIRLCKTSPKFLASNATSHTWVFSAIAELIDNAYDPDVQATQIRIYQTTINGQNCLVFIDDGNGLNEEDLYRMLSFGYSDKPDDRGYKPIGRYGNGFKSGSMRLGKDAMVLTKQKDTLSVGLLSQTFHERINADTVRIPIVTFDRETLQLAEPAEQNRANLQAILEHSIFPTEDELMDQLTIVPDFDPRLECGTKIIIWNLRELGEGLPELIYRADIQDIVFTDPDYSGPVEISTDADVLDYEHSLRNYCSILYLRPRMKIYIMNKKVKSRLIAKDLCKTEVDTYTMKGQDPLKITFGFNPTHGHRANNKDFGIMIYHKNRLIKAYEKVGYQKQATSQGYGVVGVIEADFLTPNHNKQNFAIDEKYQRVMNALAKKLNEYWDTKMSGRSQQDNLELEILEPDCNWVQCDNCLKWRRLPPGHKIDEDANWYCTMHPSEAVSAVGCRAPEDKLDQGEIDLTTPSTYRQDKQKIVAKKRKTRSFSRSAFASATPDEDADEERPERPKRQCVQVYKPVPELLNDVRRKIYRLRHDAQSLLAEAPVVIGDVADALHHDRERGMDNDEYRTVLCTQCNAWKKLPIGTRVENANEWECRLHPDESQRQCEAVDNDYESDGRSSVGTEELSTTATPSTAAGPSGIQRPGTRLRSMSSEVDVQTRSAIATLDPAIEEEDSDDSKTGIRDMQKDVDALAVTLDTVKRTLIPRVKPEVCSVGCQAETTEQVAPQAALPCANCDVERERLEVVRREIAQLLNLLLDDQNIQEGQAFETVRMLIRNDMDKKG